MPKPSEIEARFNARRKEIREALWRVVARDGLTGLTFRSLAGEMGFSTAVISHHFEDKDALLEYALGLFFDEIEASITGALQDNADDPLQSIIAACLANLPATPERLAQWKGWTSFLETLRIDPRHAREHKRRYARLRNKIAAVFAQATRSGRMPEGSDPKTEAELLLALIDGIGVHATLEPDNFARARQRLLIETYLRGRFLQPGAPKGKGSKRP